MSYVMEMDWVMKRNNLLLLARNVCKALKSP